MSIVIFNGVTAKFYENQLKEISCDYVFIKSFLQRLEGSFMDTLEALKEEYIKKYSDKKLVFGEGKTLLYCWYRNYLAAFSERTKNTGLTLFFLRKYFLI